MNRNKTDIRKHAATLNVPVFKGMKMDRYPDETTIFFAQDECRFVGFAYASPCVKEEVEKRVKDNITLMQCGLKTSGCINADNCVRFLETYSSDEFDFHIYVADLMTQDGNDVRCTRILQAFFHEPRLNDLYMVSFGMGVFHSSDDSIKPFVIDRENDAILRECEESLKIILNGVRYKDDQVPILH